MRAEFRFYNDNSANNGKIGFILFDDDPASADGTKRVSWGVTDPNGTVLLELDSLTQDFATDTQSVEEYVDIPLDSDGNYIGGVYSFQYRWDVDPFTGLTTTNSGTFNYQPNVDSDGGDAVLTASFNCLNGKITATDTTPLEEDWVLDSRLISVLPPLVAGQPDPVAETSTDAEFETTFEWNNAPYQVTLNRVHSYTEDIDDLITVIVLEQYLASATLNIVCNTSLCSAAACLATEFAALDALGCNAGGWGYLTQLQKAKAEKALYNTVIALAYKSCGDITKAAEYAAEADSCGCGCSDTSTDTPTPYTPPTE